MKTVDAAIVRMAEVLTQPDVVERVQTEHASARVEIMAPAVRHYCRSERANTGSWCNADRDQPIQRNYVYAYTCTACGQTFRVKVERVQP